jgi:hypothetical protein
MPKGNIAINKKFAKIIENGRIIQEMIEILFDGRMMPIFTPISPTNCIFCGSSLKFNENYTRYIISSYGIIKCPVAYWICSNPGCGKHHTDMILGVTGSANYSDEYKDRQIDVRYNGRCTLWNTRIIGETYTKGLTDVSGRAPCPTTLWIYEQKGGKISAQKLAAQEINFDGTLYIDGYFVKVGWRKFIETQIGRTFTDSEWKKMRYKVIYVVATKDKVVLDFEITNNMPNHVELIPLLKRIKERIPEAQINKIVSDEDRAIIGAVKVVFPKTPHAFCVFHQMKTVTKKFSDEFKQKEDIPIQDMEVYETANELIAAENAIESTILYRRMMNLSKNSELSKASRKVIKYINKIFVNNLNLLKMGFIPETNNAMEEIFSLINDFVNQTRSLKRDWNAKNFFNNLFAAFNKRSFNTGKWRGYSPVERAKTLNG